MNINQNIRYDYLDYSKAIAITFIVFFHIYTNYLIIASCMLSTFLFIGGLFAKDSNVTLKLTIVKGVRQLLIPYFLLSILTLPFCWISPYMHPELYYGVDNFKDIYLRAFVGIFLMCDQVTPYSFLPCSPLWFLPALFWCRVWFAIWVALKKYNYAFFSRAIFLGILLFILLNHINIFSLSSAVSCFPIFMIGYYVKQFVFNHFVKFKPFYVFIIGIISFSGLYVLSSNVIVFNGPAFYGSIPLIYLNCIFGLMLIISIGLLIDRLPWGKLKKAICYAGTATLVVLAFHGVFIHFFKGIFKIIGYDLQEIPFISNFFISMVIVAGCMFIHTKVLLKYLPSATGKSKIMSKKLYNTEAKITT